MKITSLFLLFIIMATKPEKPVEVRSLFGIIPSLFFFCIGHINQFLKLSLGSWHTKQGLGMLNKPAWMNSRQGMTNEVIGMFTSKINLLFP